MKSKQHDQVIEAMERLGGIAKLTQLNAEEALSRQILGWATRTPYATIRRIVQERPEFYKIRPGLYCLSKNANKYAGDYETSDSGKASQKNKETNHSYYQGILAEIGNAKSYETHIPAQDRDKKSLNSRLRDITSIENLPAFSYPHILHHAKTIDVVWINRRGMPSKFIEVESTTEMEKKLVKFVELQDFFADMIIAAPESRRREFERKMIWDAFYPVRKRVSFLSFDKIDRDYERAMVRQIIEGDKDTRPENDY